MLVFDWAEAINQAISAVVTVGGVFGGGLLAFRLGIKQLRRERALDRRLAMYERLVGVLQEYRSDLRVLARNIEHLPKPTAEQRKFRDYVLQQATDHGRAFQRVLGGVDLYGTIEEQSHGKRLFKLQLDLYMAAWTAAMPSPPSPPPAPTQQESLPKLQRLISELEREEAALIRQLRTELDLPQGSAAADAIGPGEAADPNSGSTGP